jgi:hypothetical protein
VPSRRRRQRLELVVGVLLMAGCALGAVVLAPGGRDRTPVVALAGDVERGEVIEDGDLSVTYVGADSPVAHVPEDERASLVGQAALVDLPAGTIVTAGQLAAPAAVAAQGDGTVGVALEAGQLPSLGLAAGDQVSVVAGSGSQGAAQGQGVVVDTAEVVATRQLDDQPASWWVSLRAGEGDARRLATAISDGARVQLVLVRR